MGKPRQVQPVWLLHITHTDHEELDDDVRHRVLVCENLTSLNRHVLSTIAEYVQGNWDEYDDDDIKKLRNTIDNSSGLHVIDVWNAMSVLKLRAEEDTVRQVPKKSTDLRWPEDHDRPVYASSKCNFGHYLDTGEAVNKSHSECWIHPMILKTECEYDVDTVYRVEEAFAKELEDEDWDDWDAIVQYLKDNGHAD